MIEVPDRVMCLRIWIALVAFMALGNSFACLSGNHSFLISKLYNGLPAEVTGLTARLFGTWTLLASILRAYCSMFLTNKPLYHLTLLSFVLAFLHFTLELSVYESCALDVGVISPLVVSGVSTIWMSIGLWFMEFDQVRTPSTRKSRKS